MAVEFIFLVFHEPRNSMFLPAVVPGVKGNRLVRQGKEFDPSQVVARVHEQKSLTFAEVPSVRVATRLGGQNGFHP
jgi:hypothetical protein